MNRELLKHFDLLRFETLIERFEKPAVAFHLSETKTSSDACSRLGGLPLLPPNYEWPCSRVRPLDFLLQIDLAEVASVDLTNTLPSVGLLTFFYDLENEPWGYDPAELDELRVELITDEVLIPRELPSAELALPEHSLNFTPSMTIPHFGSRAYDLLALEAQFTDAESDRYLDMIDAFERRFYPAGAGLHRLLGHSANVQGDMQLEAQLVTNGLYCGDSSGYDDPRAKELESGVDDWVLLLQLDTDDRADIMWGDAGMLYYWIRSDDLRALRFDRVWMALQCG